MFVVREFDYELSFIFRFCRLSGAVWLAEYETPNLARRGAHVTDRANSRTRGHERLPREKLLSMTTNTGVMVWKVGDVGKIALRGPLGRDLVASVAGQTLMLFR